MSKKKSFWPYGIVLAILAVVVMSVGTVMVALKHPVQMDEAYLKKYQNVDNHINEIIKEQNLFNSQYKFIMENKNLKLGENNLIFDVIDKYTNRHADNLNVKIKITRPDDDRSDFILNAKDNGEKYQVPSFDIKKEGRWIVLFDISNGKIRGYFKKELDTN